MRSSARRRPETRHSWVLVPTITRPDQIRPAVARLARTAGIPRRLPAITIGVLWLVPDRRDTDTTQAAAALTEACAGLVDAGIVTRLDRITTLPVRVEHCPHTRRIEVVVRRAATAAA